jgi:hypothetical protein
MEESVEFMVLARYIQVGVQSRMKLIGYSVLFLVCLFVSFWIVGSLFPGSVSELAQRGKGALSFVVALVLTVVIAKLINKMR